MVKNPPAGGDSGDIRDRGFDPWVGKIPWRRAWQPIPVLLPGKCYGQRSLENAMDRGGWQATGHGVAKSQTWLSGFTFNFGIIG